MSALLNEPAFASEHVESLKRAVVGDQSAIDWLVISHNDPEMFKRITGVTGKGTSSSLLIPQADWDFQSEELSSALDWSINHAGAKHLLLVGHSAGSEPESAGSERQSPPASRLFGGTREMLVRAQQAKSQFADNVDSVLANETVQRSLTAKTLRLHALFYLAYSETFLMYNPASREFQPLGSGH